MFKSRKGSITVIALVMLLFLVVLAGAWVIMMTQERTNSYGDEKQQQAYYAAEAGYKRAALLLTHGYADWNSIITTNSNLKINEGYKNDKWKLNTDGLKRVDGTTVEDANDKTDATGGPWYAFSIVNSTDKADVTAAASTGTYTITSMGYYMGELKTVTHDVKITNSGSGGSGIGGYNGIAQAGQNIVITNPTGIIGDGGDKNNPTYSLYSKNITDYTGGQYVTAGKHYGGIYTKDYITHLPIDTFFDLAKYKTNTNYAGEITASWETHVLEAGKIYSMDLAYSEINKYFYQKFDATAGSGATLVLYNTKNGSASGTFLVNEFKGPTSGAPVNIISLDGLNGPVNAYPFYAIYMPSYYPAGTMLKGNYSGRIRVISNGSILIANEGNWAPNTSVTGSAPNNAYMFFSNGWIIQDSPLNVAYLSSNYVGNASYDNNTSSSEKYFSIYLYKDFTGEVLTPGSIFVKTNISYSNAIFNDSTFPAPDGITVWNSK